MAKKYKFKITLPEEVVDAMKAKGYDPVSYIKSSISDIVGETTIIKAKNIIATQHKQELEDFDKRIKAESVVEEEK